MTETEWLACTDPAEMMRSLRLMGRQSRRYLKPVWFAYYKKDLADRKVRLLLLACCQRLCTAIADTSCVELLEMAKQFVENPPPLLPRNGTISSYFGVAGTAGVIESSLRQPIGLALAQLRLHVGRMARLATGKGLAAMEAERGAIKAEAQAQCRILRDIMGNPFRPVKCNRAWRTSRTVTLAQNIYDDLAFDRLPVLADAIEETGCHDADILAHCRGTGPHSRGCWVVDLILAKS
jgi:hypothetical protein